MKCNFCDRIIWPWQSRLHTVTFNPFHLTCGIAYELGFDKGYEVAKNNSSLKVLSCSTLPESLDAMSTKIGTLFLKKM